MSHDGAVSPKLYDDYYETVLRNELVIAISKFSRGELKSEDLENLLQKFVELVNANRMELDRIIEEGEIGGYLEYPPPPTERI